MKFIDVYLVLTAKLRAAPHICCLGFLNSSHWCSTQLLPCLYMCILTPPLQIRNSLLWPFKTFFFLNSHCGHQPYTIQCTGRAWKPRGISGTPNMKKAFLVKMFVAFTIKWKRMLWKEWWPVFHKLGSERLRCLWLTWSSPIVLIQTSGIIQVKAHNFNLSLAFFPEWRFRWRRPLCYQ